MKLLIESAQDYKILTEENAATGGKDYYIAGIFMQSNVENRNGRVYPKEVMQREVDRYITESVKTNRAVGELGHPKGPQMNADRVCHRITEMKMIGDDVVGKALILDTEAGKTLKAFIDGGVSFGVSSRALGSTEEINGVDVVQDDFQLFAIDAVMDPSAPDAFVTALMESREWVWEGGILVEKDLTKTKKKINEAHRSVDKDAKSAAVRDAFYEFIRGL